MKKSSIGNKIKRLISTAIALSLLIAPIASNNKVYADNGYNTDGSNGGSNTVSGTVYAEEINFNSKGKIDTKTDKMYI